MSKAIQQAGRGTRPKSTILVQNYSWGAPLNAFCVVCTSLVLHTKHLVLHLAEMPNSPRAKKGPAPPFGRS